MGKNSHKELSHHRGHSRDRDHQVSTNTQKSTLQGERSRSPHKSRHESRERRHHNSSHRSDRDRERDRDRRENKGRKHHHRSYSSSSRDSHYSDKNQSDTSRKHHRHHRDRKSRSPPSQSAVAQTEEQKRMIRLAKARILASHQLAQDELEQQKLNQSLWESSQVQLQQKSEENLITVVKSPQHTVLEPEARDQTQTIAMNYNDETPNVINVSQNQLKEELKVEQVVEEITLHNQNVGKFMQLPDVPANPQPSLFRKSKFADRQSNVLLPSNPVFQQQITLKPALPQARSGFVFNFKPVSNIFSQKLEQSQKKNSFAPEIGNTKIQLVALEEIDPLDAFMDSIQADVVDQEQFSKTEVSKDEPSDNHLTNDVITADDVMAEYENMGNLQDNLSSQNNEEEDEEFHQRFIRELQKKDQLEQINQSRGVNFEEDDDHFIIDLNQSVASGIVGSQTDKTFAQSKEVKKMKRLGSDGSEFEIVKKNLYIESKEISEMTEKQVKQFRKESGNIQVRGLNCPRPIQNWYQCGLPTTLLNFMNLMNFQKPFPIQCQTIPAIMSGRDLIGIAETGSGKTLAYVLPMLRHVRNQRPIAEGDGPICIIFAPTRELVLQIYKETRQVARACDLTVVPVYGGVSVQNQLSDLKRGTEIVVCTPGRMRDVLAASNGRITNLRRVSYIVLDEADRMLDMGFEPQIKVIIQNCRPDRQIVMFSATFPRSIENLAKSVLKTPIEVVVGNRGQTCSSVEQKVEVLQDSEEKLWKLVELLGLWYEKGSILIFVEKQIDADDLFKELFNIGYKCLVLHGGMDQTDREFTIQDFKERVRNILIATSVCARGLDIKHIQLVVNYVCPNHIEDYVHRVGRTGRAGNKGTAITFITPEECTSAADLIRALESSNQEVPETLRDLDDLYQKKLQDGDIERRRSNIGFVGKGFKHSKDEEMNVKKQRHELAKSFGYAVDEDSDDETTAQNLAKKELDALKQDHYQLVVMLERDPIAKKQAMEAGHKASIEAIKQGLSFEEATRLSREAMLLALQAYKPGVVSQDKAIQQVMKIRDQFIRVENQRVGIHTEEIDINDLPPMVRAKIQGRDFLQTVSELSGSSIQLSVKGQHFEIGHKPLPGQNRLHLLIEAPSKQEAQTALKEIKRNIEEVVSCQQFTARAGGSAGFGQLEFSGQFGKF